MIGSATAEAITEQYARRCTEGRSRRMFVRSIFNEALEAVQAKRPVKIQELFEAEQLCRSLYPHLSDVLDRYVARQAERGRIAAEALTEEVL